MDRIAPDSEADSKRSRRATMMMTGGCMLLFLALVSLWTAVMLYSGLATSLAWGEPPGNETIWVRQDVPLLVRIAIAALVPAAILLTVGVRRMMRITAARRAGPR